VGEFPSERRETMKKLILLTGVLLVLITMVASNNQALAHGGSGICMAPIIVSN
jgi:hypothetical protein